MFTTTFSPKVTLPKAKHLSLIEHIMATPRAGELLESEDWQSDELSELKGLLQQAEQRMRKPDLPSKHTMKATKSYTYATAAHLPMLPI